MVTSIADSAEPFDLRSKMELADPAGTSKSVDLEPFRNSIILKTFRVFRIRTYKEVFANHHKSFIFNAMIILW
jgi:hypothetical protein